MSKLSPEEVQAIRDIYRLNPKASYRNLAKQFGVSKSLIGKIIKGEIYKNEE